MQLKSKSLPAVLSANLCGAAWDNQRYRRIKMAHTLLPPVDGWYLAIFLIPNDNGVVALLIVKLRGKGRQ